MKRDEFLLDCLRGGDVAFIDGCVQRRHVRWRNIGRHGNTARSAHGAVSECQGIVAANLDKLFPFEAGCMQADPGKVARSILDSDNIRMLAEPDDSVWQQVGDRAPWYIVKDDRHRDSVGNCPEMGFKTGLVRPVVLGADT